MSVPNEVIIAAPYQVYTAPVGTAFTSLDDLTPDSPWALLGTSGNLNYDEGAAITVNMDQETREWRGLGDAGTRKVWRPSESLMVGVTLVDMSLEQFRHAVNMNAVTTQAAGSGTAGYKKIGLSRGLTVSQVALMVRGVSPYDNELWIAQFEVPIAFVTGSQEFKLGGKDGPSMLALQWKAVIDPNATSAAERFGRYIAQHATAL